MDLQQVKADLEGLQGVLAAKEVEVTAMLAKAEDVRKAAGEKLVKERRIPSDAQAQPVAGGGGEAGERVGGADGPAAPPGGAPAEVGSGSAASAAGLQRRCRSQPWRRQARGTTPTSWRRRTRWRSSRSRGRRRRRSRRTRARPWAKAGVVTTSVGAAKVWLQLEAFRRIDELMACFASLRPL
ncbi:unnamed protein product [Prorocentrum cordatum]|uniref:Phenylalanine--tRNA ligase n=1 Tax=Prorocentrum cordatum TaxID=2364126 RepID=A0ABN9S7Y7_9DINO|nr:unnamed protein product [Polarella glacialis]